VTANPDGGWVAQQVRNLTLVLGDQGRQVRVLLRDRDAKFTRSFDDVFRSEGAEVLRTPMQAPNANAYTERWIGTIRAECLDWLPIVERGHCEATRGTAALPRRSEGRGPAGRPGLLPPPARQPRSPRHGLRPGR
jgi:putative transposase